MREKKTKVTTVLATFCILSTLSLTAKAAPVQNIIISDIDDTLKRSHILGTKLRAIRSKTEFTGLSALFNAYAAKKDQGQRRIVDYVSATPKVLLIYAHRFIDKANFPEGRVFGRKSLFSSPSEFKYKKIDSIISDYLKSSPGTQFNFYLIGDNGQADAEVYKKIEQKYLKSNNAHRLNFKTYIHWVYSTEADAKEKGVNLYERQKPYLTALDLGLEFYNEGLINTVDIKKVHSAVKAGLNSPKGKLKIKPNWMQCQQFDGIYTFPSVNLNQQTNSAIKSTILKTIDLCSK